jgi:hypothetical protein
VSGVSLIDSCDNYDPIGLLLWLPLDKQYGLWDGEHGTLLVFEPEVTWTEIAEDLPRHINAEWGLDGSAPVSNLAPWVFHSYNDEQTCQPLPNLQEWYEAGWVRRGLYINGVQMRFPEEIRIRVESNGDKCEVSSQFKKAEKNAEWSPPETLSYLSDKLREIEPQLEAGFWNPLSEAPGGPGGETATYWSITGFRDGKYHKLFRSFGESRSKGDAVHELGKQLARLAGLQELLADY